MLDAVKQMMTFLLLLTCHYSKMASLECDFITLSHNQTGWIVNCDVQSAGHTRCVCGADYRQTPNVCGDPHCGHSEDSKC
jgi:hypothetical protein